MIFSGDCRWCSPAKKKEKKIKTKEEEGWWGCVSAAGGDLVPGPLCSVPGSHQGLGLSPEELGAAVRGASCPVPWTPRSLAAVSAMEAMPVKWCDLI